MQDTTTDEGVHQPTSSLRSGGPDRSCRGTRWAGRAASSPAADRHRATSRSPRPALEPIRAYAGLESADGQGIACSSWPSRDLERAGGFAAQEPPGGHDDWQRLGRPGARSTSSSTSAAATRRPSRSSTPTCRPGCPISSTSRKPGRRAAPCSTRSTTVGRSCRRRAAEAVRGRREPGILWRRVRVQWRVRPAQPHRRHPVCRAAQLQHPLP